MAEEFFPYHVPQRSRRDKLRVSDHNNFQPLGPFYEPLSDFVTSGGSIHADGVKEEGMNLMGFVGGMNPSHVFVDPQGSVQLNPSSISDFDANGEGDHSYGYSAPSCYRSVLDQSFLGNAPVVYKPEALQITHQDPDAGGGATSGQSLSLSLSSHQTNLPLELNLHRYDSAVFSANNKECSGGYNLAGSCSVSSSIELSKSTVPLGPFTGYASILKGSRFLKPAQQLLEEICDVSRGILAEINGAAAPDSSLMDPSPLNNFCSKIDESSMNCTDGSEQTRKKSRLLSMLDEVYKRYKQYYHQMQNAVAAFESVAGLSGAAPFAILALKAMSKHFRFLKNAIIDQLQFSTKSHSQRRKESPQSLENVSSGSGHRHVQGSGFGEPAPVWRPQRGLPERAVSVLRAWLFEHFLHPYPTDTDKIMLATQTGLSRNQVSNWFINARVRLWKPMVEEIHILETRQNQSHSQRNQDQEQPTNHQFNDHENNGGELSLKRARDNPIQISGGVSEEGLMKLQYDVDHRLLQSNSHMGGGGAGVSNGGVSLTLGLHQNGVGLSDSYVGPPISAARRLGLEPHGEGGYVVGDFPVQNRQFGNIGGGQLMHDFVG